MKKTFNIKAQVTHIALHVKDTKKSESFYKTWCGMKKVHSHPSQGDDQDVIWMASPGQGDDFVIVLVPGVNDNRQSEGMRHIGFAMESKKDVKSLARKAEKAGLLHWGYARYNWPVGTLCALKDPDGHIVEFSYGQPLGKDFKQGYKLG